jgi:hypothetical protein
MKNLIKKYWPFFSLVVIVSFFFWKFFLKGLIPFPGDFVVGMYYPWLDYKWGFLTGVPIKNPIVADVPSFMYPMQTFAFDLVKKGNWPLWNPRILAGIPLLANFQSAPLSPTFFLYFLFDKGIAWSFQIILAHLLAALFTYLLLRRWQVSKWGSILGGIVFAFSGYNLIWSQWNGHVLTAAFIPLILLFEDKWLKEKNYLSGIGIAVVFCLQIFSGYPQTIIYSALAVGLYWIVIIWGEKDIIRKTVFLIILFVLGLGLAAPQLLPGKELFSLSQWQLEPHPYGWAFLPWKKTITFLAPDFFGNHATKNYWGPQDYTSNTGFVGVVALILCLLSISLIKKRKEVLFAAILLIVSLFVSYPTFVSIFLWKYNLLGMRSSSAHRALVLFNLAVALLAGFGYDLAKLKIKLRLKLISILIPFLILFGFGLYVYRIHSIVGLRNLVLPTAVLISSSFILLLKPKIRLVFILLSIIELFYFGWKFTPFSSRNLVFPKTPVLEFLMDQTKPFRIVGSRVIPVNLAMPYGLESLEGYETMRPSLASRFLASINSESATASPAGRYGIIDNVTSPLLDLVNTKYYLSLKKDSAKYDAKRFKIAFEDKSVVVLESKTALPRSFMVYDWEIVKDDKEILNKLLDKKYPFRIKIILEENPNILASNKMVNSEVRYLEYKEQENIMEVKTEKDGMLFVSDTYYPGWKAYLDGKETKIFKADFAFRGVEVPKGVHEIKFLYQPKSFFNGLIISVFSSVITVLGAIYFSLKKRK